MILLLWACAKTTPQAPEETLPPNPHSVAILEAEALVPDPTRGGPPIHPGSAPLPPFQGVSRSTSSYVGAQACQGCHPQAYEAWASSSHAHSMDTLRHDRQEHNPSCLSCHWAARLERLGGEPIRGRHTTLGEGALELELALEGKLVSVSGRVDV